MRLIIARCEARCCGRLNALLPEALRLIMLKADGSVVIHADAVGDKPLNFMTPPASRAALGPVLSTTGPAHE